MTDTEMKMSMPTEKAELIDRLAFEVFTPALQQAAQQAEEQGAELLDTINAAANAFASMLEMILGTQAAAMVMTGLSDHLLKKVEEGRAKQPRS